MTDTAPTHSRAPEPDSARSSSPRPDRTMWIVLGVVALIVLIAIVVIMVRPSAPPPDPESAEGVVYQYLEAVLDGDTDAASALLSPSVTGEECRHAPLEPFTGGVSITSSNVRGDRADVIVTVTRHSNSGTFGGSSWEYPDTFALEKVKGNWLITWAPWTFTVCEPGDRS